MAGFSVPQFQFVYQGLPASGGSVNVYQTGTTTPVTCYSDGGLTTPISNPITLDANGECKFYVSGSVNLRMDGYTATGTLIESIDPVFPTGETTGFTGTGTDLNKIAGITNGVAQANKALVVDSSENVIGLITATPNMSTTGIANMAAVQLSMVGGFINKFRNGNFDIWQRGITGTITAGTPAYTADGWIVGSSGANITWAQIANLSSNNYWNLGIIGAAGVTDTFIRQRIESYIAEQLSAGTNSINVQIFMLNLSGTSITPTLTVAYANAQDNFSSTTTVINVATQTTIPNSGSAILSYAFPANSNMSNGLQITWDIGASIGGAGKAVRFWGADIREMPGAATGITIPPVQELRPYPIELIFNQRYLASFGDLTGIIGQGAATSTSASGFVIPFKVPMRIIPTALSVTTAADFEIANYAGSDIAALTALTFSTGDSSNQAAFVTATISGTPLTSATPYFLYTKTALAGNLLFTGAEL